MRGAIHAVLDFLVTFFIKKKGKNKNLPAASTLRILRRIQHVKQITNLNGCSKGCTNNLKLKAICNSLFTSIFTYINSTK
jgi:hypothetical protein